MEISNKVLVNCSLFLDGLTNYLMENGVQSNEVKDDSEIDNDHLKVLWVAWVTLEHLEDATYCICTGDWHTPYTYDGITRCSRCRRKFKE